MTKVQKGNYLMNARYRAYNDLVLLADSFRKQSAEEQLAALRQELLHALERAYTAEAVRETLQCRIGVLREDLSLQQAQLERATATLAQYEEDFLRMGKDLSQSRADAAHLLSLLEQSSDPRICRRPGGAPCDHNRKAVGA